VGWEAERVGGGVAGQGVDVIIFVITKLLIQSNAKCFASTSPMTIGMACDGGTFARRHRYFA
jgi:hypothetical protein